MRHGIVILTIAGLIFACSHNFPVDPSVHATDANDITAVIEAKGSGCLSRPQVGFTLCRKEEGDIADHDVLTFYGPKSNCDRDSCVMVAIWDPAKQLVRTLSFPKNKTTMDVKWRDLLESMTYEKRHRGIWQIFVVIYWKDHQGVERRTLMEGEVRLRVFDEGYLPLHTDENNRNFAFEASYKDGRTVKITTSGRAFAE